MIIAQLNNSSSNDELIIVNMELETFKNQLIGHSLFSDLFGNETREMFKNVFNYICARVQG